MTASSSLDDGRLNATVPLIIGNKDVVTSTTFEVMNPETGTMAHECSSASVADAMHAVDSAQTAFPAWSQTKPAVRRDILLKTADIFLQRKEEFLDYMRDETGAERMFSEFSFMLGVNLLKDIAGRISSIEGTVPVLAEHGSSGLVYKEPFGVILGIAPWNAPYILGMRAVALPLAAGNTAILKGSELSPRCFWAIGDAFRQADLPEGCLNVIYHRPTDAAAVTTALIAHSMIKKVSFTGSTAVGSIVASTAGRHVKPILLELGGKASCIILDDADLENAAMGCALGSFMHSGQICMSTERIIVQHAVADKFCDALKRATRMVFAESAPAPILIGTGLVAKNRGLVRDAVSKGAGILIGDANTEELSNTRMRPIVIDRVTKEMDVYQIESFGPSVSLFVVDTDAEAIMLANDTEYGLTAAVYTENLKRGLRIARQIESGAVHINSMTVHDEAVLPHGGVKKSGFGRFGGSIGLDEFLRTKSVTWKD